jgi:hypothetical protein
MAAAEIVADQRTACTTRSRARPAYVAPQLDDADNFHRAARRADVVAHGDGLVHGQQFYWRECFAFSPTERWANAR